MKSFKDKNGESWIVELNVGTLLSIKNELDIDLLDKPGDFPTTVSAFVDVLWVSLLDQIQERKLNEIDFAKCLDGETINTATDCFVDELSNFFLPVDAAKAKAIKGLWTQIKQMKTLEEKQIENVLGVVSSVLEESSA